MVFAQDKKHSDKERWICIYPSYINNQKTLAQGRRIPKEKAVENPNYEEIRDVLSSAGLQVGVENKLYPRENSKELLFRGRIRVQLKQDNGKPVKPEFPSRDSLLLYLAENIPKLKSRQNRPAEVGAAAAAAAPVAAAGKKNKGKR
ncbi:signal recognition particle 19 kDa protein-like [Amphibalanus amphitrite]|uniref:signal recognition particle 19 kDa protein-like n=1 Tax=Amphibalanus amphitrite TaxID=1232801 RepID=UPI001C90CFA7|nr:signal recognition particle 19 kDa protein-like [Amphibalanus amphitrite]